MRGALRAAIALLGAGALHGSFARGATLHVPGEYPTIQAGIDAASPGDSVLVGPGTWTDRDTRQINPFDPSVLITSCGFLKAPLAVIGTEGAEATIVDGGDFGPAAVITFVLARYPVGDVLLQGLTITGGGGAAIDGRDSDRIIIQSCRVIGMIAPDRAVPDSDPHRLADLKHYRSLMPLAQDARKPMFLLKAADGAIGGHAAAVSKCFDDFAALTANLLDACQIL